MKPFIIILIIVVVAVLLQAVYRILKNYYTGKVILDRYLSEKKLRGGNRSDLKKTDYRRPVVEAFLMKYGASPVHTKNQDKLKLQTTYKFKDTYFRVDDEQIDGQDFLVLHAMEDPKLVDVGIMDGVAIFPLDMPDEKIDEEISNILTPIAERVS